ncbi:MAG: hypothetical protein VW618_06705, partial [Alphaproteobacteria bacterium]
MSFVVLLAGEPHQVGRLELVDVGAERGRTGQHLEVAARKRVEVDPADRVEGGRRITVRGGSVREA